uniref:Uncharacterized protein n=1 Tax=Trichobilharzia regenti TaxID=157069 RepID=A0AA85ILM4_TRIRE|nr:unnamed protein product [Trichobilharzia regenti]
MSYASEQDIQWPPNRSDIFVVIWKQHIYLFRIEEPTAAADNTKSFIIGSNNIFPQCVAWVSSTNKASLDVVPDHLIAVTLSGGCIRLIGLPESNVEEDRFGLQNKELVPRFTRNTIFLAWNPWKRNLLAQGLDKPRNSREPSVLIWDVTKYTGSRPVNTKSAERDTVCASGLHAHSYSLPFALTGLDYSASDSNTLYPLVSIYSSKKEWISDITTCDKSLCDIGIQDTVSSFAWLSKSSFIAGMSGTYLKVFDLSDPSKASQTVTTRAVNGLTVDPLCSKRFASFCERQISIWRLDNLEKPVYTFFESGDVQQIKWSPLREAWLGVLLTDSCSVKLYDTYPMFCQPLEEPEQIPVERLFFPSSRSNVSLVAFSWHPSIMNCLLTLDRDGYMDVAHLVERAAIGWSANQTLVWSYGCDWTAFSSTGITSSNSDALMEFLNSFETKHLEKTSSTNNNDNSSSNSNTNYVSSKTSDLTYQNSKDKDDMNTCDDCKTQTTLFSELKQTLESDISVVMQKRAELGYGLDAEGATYVDIVKDDAQLRTMWTWIKYINDYMDDSLMRRRLEVESSQSNFSSNQRDGGSTSISRRRVPSRCLGVISVVCESPLSPGAAFTSEVIEHVEWQGIDAKLPFSRYWSPERSRVLRLCMWPLDDTDVVQRPVFESLCSEGQYERAAAMALMNLKFDWALSFLNRASSDSDIGLVALALAGYTDTRNELWRTTCANLIKHVQNPYLRVMFMFLSRQGGDFEPILNDDALCLIDRVAFACLYLNDDSLVSFVRSTCRTMVKRGQLEAILLTGLCSDDFITLIQNYVDITGDVQSAAIVGLHASQLSSNDSTTSITSNDNKRTDTNSNGMNTPRRSQIGLNNSIRSVNLEKRLSTPINSGGGGGEGRNSSSNEEQITLVKLGGPRLANWVQCYRDLLDQWQMWFYRADFDITYKSRLLSDYMSSGNSSKSHVSSSLLMSSKTVEPDTGSVTINNSTTSFNSNSSPTVSSASTSSVTNTLHGVKVRSIGLVAGANQVFVACGFCGWRLEPQSNKVNVSSLGSAGTSGTSVSGNNTQANNISTAGVVTSSSIIDTSCSSTASNLQMHGGGGKQTICQHCRKPLPRCSICLMHLGTSIPSNECMRISTGSRGESMLRQIALTSAPKLSVDFVKAMQIGITGATVPPPADTGNKNNQKNVYSSTRKSSLLANSTCVIADWFVWCQACRHGGHASHLIEWFYGDSSDSSDMGYLKECPVSGCQCRCAVLDGSQILSQMDFKRLSINSSADSEESGSVSDELIGLDDIMLQHIF